MSERAIKLVQYTTDLTLAEYGVLISLASLAGKNDWRCRSSLSTLAAISNVERRTAVRAVQRLTAPYKLPDLRPLVHRVENSKVKLSSVYELNVELLRELKQKRERDVLRTPPKAHSSVVTTPPGGTTNSDLEDLIRAIGTNHSTSAAKAAKKSARDILQMLADLSDESLTDLATKIAVRHPLSRLRNWTQLNVTQTDRVAILKAMEEQAQIQHKTMAEVGRIMLLWLDSWDSIPRDRWQYVAAIPEFYQRGDYRLEPEELRGIDLQKGPGKRDGSGAEENAGALRQFVETAGRHDEPPDGRDSVVGHVGVAAGPEDRPNYLRGIAGRLDDGGTSSSPFPRAGRAEVRPKPSDPARIQWPRRSG